MSLDSAPKKEEEENRKACRHSLSDTGKPKAHVNEKSGENENLELTSVMKISSAAEQE